MKEKDSNRKWTDDDVEVEDVSEEELARWFEEAEQEENDYIPPFQRPWVKKVIGYGLAIMLLANVLAFWPRVYSLAAIDFLVKSAELSQNEAIRQYKQSVVVVRADQSKGTGFNITEDGLIVTNAHVVEDSRQILVQFPDGTSHPAEVLLENERVDIAILDIEADGLPVLPLADEAGGAGDEDAGKNNGPPVYVIGNPLFFTGIANEGSVMGILEQRNPPRMALDAPIYKGNSGSPIITVADGEVIGVVFATTKIEWQGESKNVGLAIPVDQVRALMEKAGLHYDSSSSESNESLPHNVTPSSSTPP